ncbi:MAG TPA: M14 family zinc carboxypeptidase [Actinophytocola sp.]|uniref:M14 family zinc carboxypeptidase n=1 Tax=Actinophytocola sp. TaxID=1872138 RepID=UPI002DBA03AD|nr:M14 family zinc carboxypeptidase [Actinophytocola sp.]HEU5474664.1 M14 family zinc carboxypeptidase [Actinophytocola sp.]
MGKPVRHVLAGFVGIPLLMGLAPPVAAAAPDVPGDVRPCSEEPRDLPIDQFTDLRELQRELDRIARTSRGRVDVDQVGTSNQGRPIYRAVVGTGPKVFLVTSEIHGNEKTGTDALLHILRYLGTSNSHEARRLRATITLVAVPKLNVDGAELDRRGNDQSWADVQRQFPQLAGRPPAWNYIDGQQQGDDYRTRPGFDVNRDFNPELDYLPRPEDVPGSPDRPGWFLTPEGQTLRDVYLDLTAERGRVPEVYVDLHHQAACVRQEGTNRFLDVAVDYPPLPDAFFEPGQKYARYAEVYTKDESRQLAISAFNGMTEAGFIGARYPHAPTRDLPGQARCSFALNGTGTVLFEVRGQTQTLGQQRRVHFTRAVIAGLMRMLNDVSTGAVDRIDPEAFDTLPGTADDSAAAEEELLLID